MDVGVNYPWKAFGNDFGGGGNPPWAGTIDGELALLSSIGVKVVRWFIVRGKTASAFGAVSSKYQSDFHLLLSKFQAHGMLLLPSWLGSGMWENAADASLVTLATDATAGKNFIARSLSPLLAASSAYKSAIYAWEACSVPDMTLNTGSYRKIAPAAMSAFLKMAVDAIHTAGFASTIGWQNSNNMGLYSCGEQVKQFHYYGWPPVLLLGSEVIGEFPTSTVAKHNFPELPAKQTLVDRLNLMDRKGHPLALAWAMHATDDSTAWNASTQSQIKLFTHGQAGGITPPVPTPPPGGGTPPAPPPGPIPPGPPPLNGPPQPFCQPNT